MFTDLSNEESHHNCAFPARPIESAFIPYPSSVDSSQVSQIQSIPARYFFPVPEKEEKNIKMKKPRRVIILGNRMAQYPFYSLKVYPDWPPPKTIFCASQMNGLKNMSTYSDTNSCTTCFSSILYRIIPKIFTLEMCRYLLVSPPIFRAGLQEDLLSDINQCPPIGLVFTYISGLHYIPWQPVSYICYVFCEDIYQYFLKKKISTAFHNSE